MITVSASPIAFTIGSVAIRWYGIFVAIAVLVVVLWTLRAVRREPTISYETVITAALIGIPSGIIFARFLHIIDVWVYTGSPGRFWGFEGLAIWGGVLGATLGIWVYSLFSKSRFGRFMDLMAPGIILSQAIGRVGCTLNGCCYGTATSLPRPVPS